MTIGFGWDFRFWILDFGFHPVSQSPAGTSPRCSASRGGARVSRVAPSQRLGTRIGEMSCVGDRFEGISYENLAIAFKRISRKD